MVVYRHSVTDRSLRGSCWWNAVSLSVQKQGVNTPAVSQLRIILCFSLCERRHDSRPLGVVPQVQNCVQGPGSTPSMFATRQPALPVRLLLNTRE